MAIIDLENPLLEIVPGRNLATLKAIITNISQIHLQTNKFKEAVRDAVIYVLAEFVR